MQKTMTFDPAHLKDLGRRHWKEFCPKKYNDLKSRHQLESSLEAAANMTLSAMEVDRAAGYSQYEAWEKNRSLYLLLPEEFNPQAEKQPDTPGYQTLVEKNKVLHPEWSGPPEK